MTCGSVKTVAVGVLFPGGTDVARGLVTSSWILSAVNERLWFGGDSH